ncbi:hypothetical protein [Eubacterium sp.]|uniref:hypothetical protein n=1 Tax=Eubacterium sp. TaxID=142586 RepID=UPI0026DEDC95|nr:hypothetical protein [Eubacterium sp.]MDO5433319.1 hypothetical protein [Eubacterium sp.]
MLDKTITEFKLTNKSTIDGKLVKSFQAVVDTQNPETLRFSHSTILDQELYKANRAEIRKDESDFEDEAYTFQDSLIAERGKNNEAENV